MSRYELKDHLKELDMPDHKHSTYEVLEELYQDAKRLPLNYNEHTVVLSLIALYKSRYFNA